MTEDTKNDNDLNIQQQKFVDCYVLTMNAKEAATMAGYAHPGQQGSRLLKHPGVKKAVQQAVADASATIGVDREWIVSKIVNAITVAEQAITPALGKSGKPIKDAEGNFIMRRDNATIMRGLELLAKIHGLFVEKVELQQTSADFNDRLDRGKELVEQYKKARLVVKND